MEPSKLSDLLYRLGLQGIVQRGGNLMACCPSGRHLDRRPSWGISLTKPHSHGCFSCGFKGTLRTLLIHKGYTRRQALLVSGEKETDSYDLKLTPKLLNESRLVQSYEPDELYPYFPTKRSDLYFINRGLTLKTIRECLLLHDTHENRVLFPWFMGDRLVAITGRALNPNDVLRGEKMKSYLEGSKKREMLYLPGRIIRREPLVVVEGELDALVVYQAGFKNVAALGHSHLSQPQADLMLNSEATEIFAFGDKDAAGEKMNEDLMDKLSRKLRVKVMSYELIPLSDMLDYDPGGLTAEQIRTIIEGSRKNIFPSWSKVRT